MYCNTNNSTNRKHRDASSLNATDLTCCLPPWGLSKWLLTGLLEVQIIIHLWSHSSHVILPIQDYRLHVLKVENLTHEAMRTSWTPTLSLFLKFWHAKVSLSGGFKGISFSFYDTPHQQICLVGKVFMRRERKRVSSRWNPLVTVTQAMKPAETRIEAGEFQSHALGITTSCTY